MSEERPRGVDPPKCKICGAKHWGVAHQWGKAESQTKANTGNGTSGVAPRVNDTESATGASGVASRPNRRGGRAGRNPAVRVQGDKVTIVHHRVHDLSDAGRKAIAEAALAAAENRTANPKPKRRKLTVKEQEAKREKRGRGRPVEPGSVPFDKKAHDRTKAAEKRAAKRKAAQPR